MNQYTAYLKSDNGPAKVTVWANDLTQARELVKRVEACPNAAIEFLGRTPTKKGIKQAKAWGY